MLQTSLAESPAQIKRLRQLAVERIAWHEREIEVARREIALYDKSLRLHEEDSTNIVPNMQAQIAAKRSRRGRPLEVSHPFPMELEKRGLTVTFWAKKHNHDRARVKSWFAVGDGGRRIPRAIAEAIEKELGVPATLRTWKNGIA